MGFRLILLTLTSLLTVLQSPAQRHGRRHAPAPKHASRLPDSVATSEEEIKPFASDTTIISSSTDAPVTVVDSSQQLVNMDTATSATPETPRVLRSIPDTTVRRWKSSRDFDYADDPSLWQKEKEQEEEGPVSKFLDSRTFRYIIYVLLGCVLLFVLYRIIVDNNLRFFYKRPVRLKDTPPEEAELPEEDLDQLLKQAIGGKEYRSATRYLYLKTLRHLDTREMIRWHSQTTDAEYVQQMEARPQGARFRWLTLAYEQVWYGKFPLDEHQFSRLSQYFQDFYHAVDHPQHA